MKLVQSRSRRKYLMDCFKRGRRPCTRNTQRKTNLSKAISMSSGVPRKLNAFRLLFSARRHLSYPKSGKIRESRTHGRTMYQSCFRIWRLALRCVILSSPKMMLLWLEDSSGWQSDTMRIEAWLCYSWLMNKKLSFWMWCRSGLHEIRGGKSVQG